MIYFDDLDPEEQPAGIDKVLENCRWDYDYGYRQFKVKIGRGNKWMSARAGLKRDIDVVNAIGKAFPDVEMLVDGNNGFTVETMIGFLQGIGVSPHTWGTALKTVYTAHFVGAYDNAPTIEGVTTQGGDVDFGENRIIDAQFHPSNQPGFGLSLPSLK